MNILLTGGAGFIGSHTAVVLSEVGYDVVLLDNFYNSDKGVIDKLHRIIGKTIPCVEGDVCDTNLVINTLMDYKIDAVVHFAGLKAVGESVKKPIAYYANNVQGAISLLEAMNSCNVKNLVFSSSATVYGNPSYLPIDEKHPTSAANPYGRTKLHIEEMLGDVAKSDNGWGIISLRYFNPVGAHKSGLIGESPNGIPNNLVPYIVKVASGEMSHVNVFGDNYLTSDGTGIRDYIHIMDLAQGHFAALNYLSKFRGMDVFNLGTGKGHSVFDVIRAFEKVVNKEIPFKISPRRIGDVASCFSTSEKARELLLWKALMSLEQMCESSWHSQKARST